MSRAPLVSIVTPAYNAGRFIGRTLASMQAQTVAEWECVVVDDGSSDNTAEVVAAMCADPRIQLFRQQNTGVSEARNNGFRRTDARTPYVTFMDSDDVWRPNALELLIRRLEAEPEAVGAHGVADFIDEEDRPYQPGVFADGYCRLRLGFDGHRIRRWEPGSPTSIELLLVNGVYPPGLVLTRREHQEAVGGFDEAVWPMEDWQMLLRLSERGPFAFVDEVILGYRRHGSNATGNTRRTRHVSHVMRHWIHFHHYASPQHRSLARAFYRPYQLHRLREKGADLRTCLKERRLARLPVVAVQMAGLLCRYLRGYPVVGGALSG